MAREIERRDFVKGVVGSVAAGTLAESGQSRATPSRNGKIIAIQIGSISFRDEGVEQVLDILQQRGHINALWLAGFTYGRGIAGRQIPGQPFPDHGKLEYDLDFHGGSFAAVHPQYYKDSGVAPKDLRAPDHGDWDFFAEVLPPARRRGMKCVTWIEDVFREGIPAIEKLQCVDLHGRSTNRLCHNNPYHRNLLRGIAEDYVRSYELDGIMYGSERQGAFTNALGMRHFGADQDPSRVECFCQYCEAKAKKLGIDFQRVKAAYLELEKFVQRARHRDRPVDGYHVTLLRLMLHYPELLIWEHFFHDSLRETYQMLNHHIKSINSSVWFGLHIWHNNSFNPIYRAEQNLSELSKYTDFLKMVMYHNCGGPRMGAYIESVSGTIWGDVPAPELTQFHYRILNYNEVPFQNLGQKGLKDDYVFRETKRAADAARLADAQTLILPGIDIDIPTRALDDVRSTPEDVKAAVIQAFQAGAEGVILSRKYSEMRLAHLSGAGAAVQELGLV